MQYHIIHWYYHRGYEQGGKEGCGDTHCLIIEQCTRRSAQEDKGQEYRTSCQHRGQHRREHLTRTAHYNFP